MTHDDRVESCTGAVTVALTRRSGKKTLKPRGNDGITVTNNLHSDTAEVGSKCAVNNAEAVIEFRLLAMCM